MTEEFDPTASLAAVRDTDAKIAQKMRWPLWRHAIVGVLMALMLLSFAVPMGWQVPIIVLVLALVFLIIRDDKKRHGMFVSGYQRGRTGWVIAVQLVLFLAVMFISTEMISDPLTSPAFWGLQAILLVGSTVLSLIWEKVYRADIQAGRA